MASLPLGGLASGVDTEFIVQQLMLLERQPKNKLELRKKVTEHRKNLLNDLNARLKALDTAAADLRSAATWSNAQTVDSSDATRVSGRAVTGAATGGYLIEVTNVARSEQRTYNYTASGSASQVTVDGVTFDVAANATLTDVVNLINGRGDSPVYAAAISGQLVLSSKESGAAGGFTASGATLAEDVPKAKVGLDAAYTVDGVNKTSATNVVTDAIPGIELTLKAPTAGPVTVTVGAPALDKAKLTERVKAFVEKYNDVVTWIKDKTSEKRVPNATTEVDAKKGALYNDGMLTGLYSRLRISVTEAQPGNPSTLDELAEIGVSTGATTGSGTYSADAVAGKLVLDEAKLTAALDADATSVKKLLGAFTGVDGFAQRLEAIVEPASAADGDVEGRIDAAEAEMARLAGQITEMDRRLAAREARLRAQFTAMERMLANSQSQGNYLAAQLQRLG
jgi:flagellar hook-associated protein 2